MADIVFMFEVHQPYRLDRRAFEKLIERGMRGTLSYRDVEEAILDNGLNKLVIERASRRCYIPASRIILENIVSLKESTRPFKVSYSISGVFLEQARRWAPEVIDVLQSLVSTGLVEVVEQTYYHSLAAFIPPDFEELREQISEHRMLIKEVFGVEPVSVENTEFIYNNDIACALYSMGFNVVLTEGVDRVLGWRSPNYVYKAYGCDMRVLTRNYRLSDDIGYRFSDKSWDQYPLTADKYAQWLSATPGDVIFIAIDYETFGEHHWPETGIYEFLRWLPREITGCPNLTPSTPSEAAYRHPARDVYDVPSWNTISWADERDLSAWLGNTMQKNAFRMLVELRPYVKAIGKPELLRLWRILTISDHYYYVATKFGSIEQVHSYFSPYKNASEAYAVLVQALAILSTLIAEEIRRNPGVVMKVILPDEKAFYFRDPSGAYIGVKANSISELVNLLERVPISSLLYHIHRGDLQRWLRDLFHLDNIADEIDRIARERIGAEEKRSKILDMFRKHLVHK